MSGAGPRVFLSYRREDTRHLAGRLADHLRPRFELFMDVEAIRPGSDFTQAVRQAVRESDVLLALIGSDWANARDHTGRRRLDDPQDWVATEIAAGLDGGLTIIPVLVDDARMPGPEDLPRALAGLASRQAVRLRHESFNDDVARLAGSIEQAVVGRRPSPPPTPATADWVVPAPAAPPRRRSPVAAILIAFVVAAVLAGGVLAFAVWWQSPERGGGQTLTAGPSPTLSASKKGTKGKSSGQTTTHTTQISTPPPQLDLPLGTTATFGYFAITVKAAQHDPTAGYLVDAEVCLLKLTGSSPATSLISWAPWSVTTSDEMTHHAGLPTTATTPPPGLFPESGQYRVGECAHGWIPFGDVVADAEVSRIGYSNQFLERATWVP